LTLSRNHRIDPLQPTRSAITVAGMPRVSANKARTLLSNGVNDVADAARSYFGGPDEATALTTVVLEIPNFLAISALATPSAANRRINAQSSIVITLQSQRVFTFQAPKLFSFRAPSTVLVGSRILVNCGEHERTFPNQRVNAGPDQSYLDFSSSSGRCAPSRHPAEGHPQVLIIARRGDRTGPERLSCYRRIPA
jgi:hypothetical protein